MLKGAASRPSKGIVSSIIGIVTLIAGATGVLSGLKSTLNTIWRTQEPGNVKEIIRKNALFVGMLLGIGFLMTVSLIISAALASLGAFFTGFLPAAETILHGIDFLISTAIISVLFAAMPQFLPNTKIEWRDVWIGAAVTSFLFNIGKIALGLYRKIRHSLIVWSGRIDTSAASLGLHSGLIFYFGAEFTAGIADRYGSRVRPEARLEALSSGHESLTARSIERVRHLQEDFEDAHRQTVTLSNRHRMAAMRCAPDAKRRRPARSPGKARAYAKELSREHADAEHLRNRPAGQIAMHEDVVDIGTQERKRETPYSA